MDLTIEVVEHGPGYYYISIPEWGLYREFLKSWQVVDICRKVNRVLDVTLLAPQKISRRVYC